MNKKVYRVGKKNEDSHQGSTEFDVTKKDITPMGGFPHYGVVNEDFLMLKVCVIQLFGAAWLLSPSCHASCPVYPCQGGLQRLKARCPCFCHCWWHHVVVCL